MFLDLCNKRRSIRKYTDKKICDEDLEYILKCALTSPTARNLDTKRFVVVRDKEMLKKLSQFKDYGADFLKDADAAVVVLVNKEMAPETYYQDGCIAATFIQLACEDIGISSCWANVRSAKDANGEYGYDVIKRLLNVPSEYHPECIIALGYKNEEPFNKKELDFNEHVHFNKF